MPNTTNLRQAGLKTTQPRLKVLDVLETSPVHHMTAEDVYKRLLETEQEIGLATVYRILTQFETAGLVIRHNFEGGRSLYELDNGAHHDHMVCVECGKVFEFVDRTIEQQQRNVATKAGFSMEDHSLSLYGVCNGMKESGRCSMSKSN
ncbi:MAG TPA: ferric iron uptake transcriptional regulator [Gammaproteobacteria bacterium]|jgi:Fur family ferric uptake transcriptional regulator|nr:ferric iron uptake transcriptional regulator [Arenicellales bacterium]HIG15477.1 ferric iron uptake transcriptional regulator [Gammaproteobacteria bacterium]HIL18338.1 ferric iron uptake transcriptional regulator [Gammaproteobacteria bacterium]|tara:strand:+ start:21 stop:464 length:444 start_codon:yes stop_codon:yes gene_type:complete